jgi:hypothetical protein
MIANLFANRASEHSFRTPSDAYQGEQGEEGGQKYYYVRLMRVSVKHTYYNLSNHDCPDFTFTPTPSSSALMKSLGLIFQGDATGFSILYDQKRKDDLLRYLQRQALEKSGHPQSQAEAWTRLSFVLTLTNPYFINFTDIPIDLDPGLQNFYFTNQDAHQTDTGGIIINQDEFVGDVERELMDVAGVQYPVNVSETIKEVRVKDISGEIVICQRRCVPIDQSPQDRAKLINCAEIPPPSPLELLQCRDVIYLDFSSLPEDKYRIEKIPNLSNRHLKREEEPLLDTNVVYTSAAPTPLCFIDLLFANPTGDDTGIYPVRDLFEPQPQIVSVNYQLKFRTRSTFWTYFVVPQPQREKFENLRIESKEQKKARQVNFAGPCCVHLANGQKGYRFISEKAIPLQQQSEFNFRLCGQHGLMTHDGVIVERLPVATKQQILRDELTVLLDVDKNLCAHGNDRRCRRLVRRLSKCFRESSNSTDELERLKRHGANPRSRQFRQQRQRCPNLYSDTYVYV